MTLTDYIAAGILIGPGPYYVTGDGQFTVWWDDRVRLWRWHRDWKNDGSAQRSHGGKPTLRGCLWDAVMA